MSDPQTFRIGFLAIGRQRPGFDPQWGRQVERRAWEACDSLLSCYRPIEQVVDDQTLRAALNEFRKVDCKALIVLQPTMGDGRLAQVLAQLWDGALVLWATPERPGADRVTACSLVGAHVFGSLFRQLGRSYELVYGDPDADSARQELMQGLRMAMTVKATGKVGLIGNHAPGFVNMHADPVELSRQLDMQLQHISLAEFYARLETLADDRVVADAAQVAAMNIPIEDGLSEADLVPNSRYYLALLDLMQEESLSGVALRCWSELPNVLGHWPYLAMMRLAEEHRCVSLEGDVDAAVLSYLGNCLGIGTGYISDWLEHDDETIVLWHPGHAPRSWCIPETIQLGRHFNNDKPLVVNAQMTAGKAITLARLWRCDNRYQVTAFTATTVEPKSPLAGAIGCARVGSGISVRERFDTLCHAGMPHHVTLFKGDQVALLKRFAQRRGIGWLDL